MKKFIVICVMDLALMNLIPCVEAAWMGVPALPAYGVVRGIDGNNIVGSLDSGYGGGFVSDGESYTWLRVPGAVVTYGAHGIDGDNIVGQYYDNYGNPGFLYDGTTWTRLQVPGFLTTRPEDIDGDNIVGWYYSTNGIQYVRGFLYDGTTWKTFNAPMAQSTFAYGVDGDSIVGFYTVEGLVPEDWSTWEEHGFLYSGGGWTTLDFPGAWRTRAYGIDGGNIVGYYIDSSFGGYHGFLYDGATWTTLDAPGAKATYPCAIDGYKVIGRYRTDFGTEYNFIYTFTTLPIADADGPYEIYAGGSLTLDATDSTGDIVSYKWDLDNDGTFETDAGDQPIFAVDFTYLESLGLIADYTYPISLQVTDSDAQSDVAESTLSILRPTLFVVIPGMNDRIDRYEQKQGGLNMTRIAEALSGTPYQGEFYVGIIQTGDGGSIRYIEEGELIEVNFDNKNELKAAVKDLIAVTTLRAIDMNSDVIVAIDMDLELHDFDFLKDYIFTNTEKSTWGKAVDWAGDMANDVSIAFRDISPEGRRRLFSHSAGGDATYQIVKKAKTKPFDDINILNGRTGADGLQRELEKHNYSSEEVKIFTCEGDYWSKPQVWGFIDGSISNYDAAKKQAIRGHWTHIHVIDISGFGEPKHSGLRDNYWQMADYELNTSTTQTTDTASFMDMLQIGWSW